MTTKFPTPEELEARRTAKDEAAKAKTRAWAALSEVARASEIAGMLVDDLQVALDGLEDSDPGKVKVVFEAQEFAKQVKGLLRLVDL